MATKFVWVGSVGPFIFDDSQPLPEVPSQDQRGIVTNSEVVSTQTPTDDNAYVRVIELQGNIRYGLMTSG